VVTHGRSNDTIASSFLVMRGPHGGPLFASLRWPRQTGCSLEALDYDSTLEASLEGHTVGLSRSRSVSAAWLGGCHPSRGGCRASHLPLTPRDISCWQVAIWPRAHAHWCLVIEALMLGTHQSVGRGTIMFRTERCKACAACREMFTRSAEGAERESSRSAPWRSPGDRLLSQLCAAAAHPIGPLRYRESG